MTINGDVTSGVRRVPGREVTAPGSAKRDSTGSQPAVAAPRDGVKLSAEGRALARATTLTPERIADVRARILSGAYDQAHVIDAVAQRILQRGDL